MSIRAETPSKDFSAVLPCLHIFVDVWGWQDLKVAEVAIDLLKIKRISAYLG